MLGVLMTEVSKKTVRALVSIVFCVIFTSTSVSRDVCEREALGVEDTNEDRLMASGSTE